MINVFISHAQSDIELATKLANDLRGMKYGVYLPLELIRAGDDFAKAITKEINDSDYLIALVSPAYERSEFASIELSLALYEQSKGNIKRIIPVLTSTDAKVPPIIQNLLLLRASDYTYKGLLSKIDETLRTPAGSSKDGWLTEAEALQEQFSALHHERAMELLRRGLHETQMRARWATITIGLCVALCVAMIGLHLNGVTTSEVSIWALLSSGFAAMGAAFSTLLHVIELRAVNRAFKLVKNKATDGDGEQTDE